MPPRKWHKKNNPDSPIRKETGMNYRHFTRLLILTLALSLCGSISAQDIPANDRRATEVRHLDLAYSFAGYATKEEWLARAEKLRKQILFSAGLWPMPAKEPLNPTIFGKIDRGDHTVEKVYFESHPGFYVTGNLYRPKIINGKAPAVLLPHGHWTYGRLESQQLNSGPARATNFARQGYVAFTYDMIGYVDSAAISHRFAPAHRENLVDRNTLWSVNLLGQQLWNSLRSVDFLLSLPEVDADRIGITGESGGGTQTFLLMAVDDRIKVSAPVNMVSFYMQGGSLCENAPNLRIDTNNVEIASLMAPRPMMMVSATGDWTKKNLSEEYPAVQKIYRLFGAEDKVTAVQMDAPHNYNQDSREAVYGWFAHWMLEAPETKPIKERGGGIPTLNELLVFFGRPRPENEMNEEQLSNYLIEQARKQIESAEPTNAAGLERYREMFGTAFNYSLMAEYPNFADILAAPSEPGRENKLLREDWTLSRKDREDRVSVSMFRKESNRNPKSIVIRVTHSEENFTSAAPFIDAGHAVLSVRCFPAGPKIPENIKFFTTYNRTETANRVQDLLTAISYVKGKYKDAKVHLVAEGNAGLLALLARALAPPLEHCAIDAAGFDSDSDADFESRLAIPGIRRAGDFLTATSLAPLTPLTIYNRGSRFRVDKIEALYRNFGRAVDFKSLQSDLSQSGLIAWLSAKQKTK